MLQNNVLYQNYINGSSLKTGLPTRAIDQKYISMEPPPELLVQIQINFTQMFFKALLQNCPTSSALLNKTATKA